MGKYSKYQRKSAEKKGMNPIWRGIGCLLIVIVPLVSYILMVLLGPLVIATGKIPYQLLGHVNFPAWVWRYRILNGIALFILNLNNLWFNILAFFVILLVLTAVTSLVYSLIYSLVGPARYSETDAPPSKYKAKKYTR